MSAFLTGTVNVQAQDDTQPEKDTRPVRNTFESIWLLDNQTVMVPIKGTFEMDILHRFGTWNNGYDDFYGVFAPSNIRIGFNYVPRENLQVGFGFTKERNLYDFNAKYAIFRQGRSGGSPVSVTYLGYAAVDTRKEEKTNFEEGTDRWSYFNQLMIARKVTDAFSIQAAASLSWFNFRDPVLDDEGVFLGKNKNRHWGLSFMGRYKLTSTLGLIAGYDMPLTDPEFNDPEANLSLGIEMVSSSHAFQIFIGNYKSIVPQYNNAFNTNNFGDNQILIGFNMTRLWNF